MYRATHLPSRGTIALKVLHADLADDARLVARFDRECRAPASLRGAHALTAHAFGATPDGTRYLAMELLCGETLEHRLRTGGPLPWQTALAIARAVCSMLDEAHRRGIVHRDLKPANIHLGADGAVKVLDLGVAKVMPWSHLDDDLEITAVGQTVGTVEYMAPEQLTGERCDPRTDFYALGLVVFEMLTGQRPFREASPERLLTTLVVHPPPRPSQIRSVPGVVDHLVLRCLALEAEARFDSAAEIAAEIDRILAGRHGRRARRASSSAPPRAAEPVTIPALAAAARTDAGTRALQVAARGTGETLRLASATAAFGGSRLALWLGGLAGCVGSVLASLV